MRKTFLLARAGLAVAGIGFAVPTAASADSEEQRNRRCAREFHAAVVEDNEAYNGWWSVAIDNVHRVSPPPPPA